MNEPNATTKHTVTSLIAAAAGSMSPPPFIYLFNGEPVKEKADTKPIVEGNPNEDAAKKAVVESNEKPVTPQAAPQAAPQVVKEGDENSAPPTTPPAEGDHKEPDGDEVVSTLWGQNDKGGHYYIDIEGEAPAVKLIVTDAQKNPVFTKESIGSEADLWSAIKDANKQLGILWVSPEALEELGVFGPKAVEEPEEEAAEEDEAEEAAGKEAPKAEDKPKEGEEEEKPVEAKTAKVPKSLRIPKPGAAKVPAGKRATEGKVPSFAKDMDPDEIRQRLIENHRKIMEAAKKRKAEKAKMAPGPDSSGLAHAAATGKVK